MPAVKCGSNVTANPSAPGVPPARSAGGFAARSSTATGAARSPAAAPPADCMPTTSGTGKTVAPPSSKTWFWYARITTGRTIEASSPSQGLPTTSPSPTARADDSPHDRWRVRRTYPHPTFHRAPDQPANAPTGGGTNPSNRNRHRQPTRQAGWRAGHSRHRPECQRDSGIGKFVCDPSVSN